MNINLTSIQVKAEEKPSPITMALVQHDARFMAKFQRCEPLIKDSTAIQALKICPRKYFYQIVLGRIGDDKVPIFAWGSAYHKFREVLEVTYGLGKRPFDPDLAKFAFNSAAQVGLNYWGKHGQDQPGDGKWAYMTTPRLMKTFVVAFEHWKKEKLRGVIEVLAVEQAFNVEILNGIKIGGRADQLIRVNGTLWGRDFKTTSKDSAFYARQLEPNDQFTRYTVADTKLAGKQVQGQYVELMYNSKPTKSDTKGPMVIELMTSRTKEQLEMFEREQGVIERTLEIYRETDVWPMHEASCPFCPYHSVCTQPTEASQMSQLESRFVVRPWDYNKVGAEDDS